MRKYIVKVAGRKPVTIASVIPPNGGPRRAPESATEALAEFAARRGWRVSEWNVDAKTRGKLTAEGYMDEAGAFKGHAMAVVKGAEE